MSDSLYEERLPSPRGFEIARVLMTTQVPIGTGTASKIVYLVALRDQREKGTRRGPLRSVPNLNEATVYGVPAETVLDLIYEARREGRLR